MSVCATSIFARGNSPLKEYINLSNADVVEIIIPAKATPFEKEVAAILETELKKTIEIKKHRKAHSYLSPAIAKIELINTHDLEQDVPISKLLKRNNYSIRVGKNRIELTYPSADKIGWVVGKFLRDFCNIKYFSPTEFGTEYDWSILKIKRGEHQFCPSYFAANFSDFKSSKRWRILNGIDVQYTYFKFGHNLNKIIPPKDYKKHPHLFALKKNADGTLCPNFYAQPDLLNPKTHKFVAEKAIEALNDEHIKMFSIGINDTQSVDERSKYESYKDGYFRGYPNWSAAIFSFSNEVAKLVAKQKPNAILGLLAYMICEKPPSFKLEKNLIPFYTTDRLNNYNIDYQIEDFKILQQWGNCGTETFGVYEYLYGIPYLMPRDFSDKSSSAISFAQKCGARLYYAEAFALWGFDTKKMWIISRMLEDSSLQYDILERQFYAQYFKSAKAPMQKFFTIANIIWKDRKIPTRWLAFFRAENTLSLLNENYLAQMSEALLEAEKLAKLESDENLIKRIEETRKCFEITKTAYELYISKIEMHNLLQTDVPAEKLIKSLQKYDTLKTKFLIAQKNAQNSFTHTDCFDLYNQERFAPLDKVIQRLYEKGITLQDFSKLKLKNVNVSATFNAIEKLNSCKHFSFTITNWKNFDCIFSTMHKDFENAYMKEEQGVLTFKNCELSGIAKNFNINPFDKIIFSGKIENVSTPGSLCYASLVFLNENNKEIERKTLVFNSQKDDNTFILANIAPTSAKKVNISIYATRQKAKDILRIKNLSIKISSPTKTF